MNTCNKSEIMSASWKMYRRTNKKLSFSCCLEVSWHIAKKSARMTKTELIHAIANLTRQNTLGDYTERIEMYRNELSRRNAIVAPVVAPAAVYVGYSEATELFYSNRKQFKFNE